MVETGLCRNVVNHRISRIKRMFKWAVAEELVPASAHHGLQAITGLQFGRTNARETDPVRPGPDAAVDAVLPYMPPTLATMVRVQRHSRQRDILALAGIRPRFPSFNGTLRPVLARACSSRA
jgi:hypothetical protein